ncbi:VWA domain-containing protein [bacterium]|nr:VWA domain-containing protein [bacterium]
MNTGKFLLLCLMVCGLALISPPGTQAQQRTLGPVLKIHTDPFLFDTVRCRARRCIPITFENIGDTTLTVHNHERLRRPFYTRIDTPVVLEPGEMVTFDLCYNPIEYSRDSQYVKLRADTRLPLSIAMVHDVSSSMYLELPDGKRRYEAAHDAGFEFIGNLLDTLDIEDEAAIYTYDYYQDFELKQWWTTDTASLRAAIPGRPLGTATCTYDALSRVIDSIAQREKMRVIIILTDGEDSGAICGAASVSSVIQKARDNNVRIYAITIGNINRQPLIDIVNATDGKEFNATQSTDLVAIYRQIAVDISKNVELDIFMKAEAVGPRIEFTPSAWAFDSVQVGETDCQPVQVRNGGNSWLHTDSVRALFSSPYSIAGLDMDSIAPYQTVPAMVCFTPLLPLHYDTPIPYFPSPCEVFADTLRGSGNSFLLPRVPRKLPLLSMGDVPSDFDTTFCLTTECTSLELMNNSDTTVTIHSLDSIPPPFTGSLATPFSLPPGEQQSITICYRPPDAPRSDTLRLAFTADARVPQQLALLFDGGEEMQTEFMPGLDRMLASVAGASDFIDGLLFDSSFTDAVAVASFDSAGVFAWNGKFLSDEDTIRSMLPDSAHSEVSCVYSAVESMIQGFDAAGEGPRNLLLFTAGEDAGTAACGPTLPADVQTLALDREVRIHCVQLGDADSTALMQLATATGGSYLRPSTLLDLIVGLREVELLLSKNVRFERSIIARGVTPMLSVARDTLDFGSVLAGGVASSRKRTLLFSNMGDAPMHLSLDPAQSPFLVGKWEDNAILPAKSDSLEIEFNPTQPGVFMDSIRLWHDGCGQEPVIVYLLGRVVQGDATAWDFPAAVRKPASLQFDTLLCGGEQCLDVIFQAADTGGTRIRFLNALPPPFYAQTPLDSIVLEEGTNAKRTICYRPEDTGSDQAWLAYETRTRPSLSTVFVLPTDPSVVDTLAEGLTFQTVSMEARRRFAETILSHPGQGDVAAVMSFDQFNATTLLEFSAYKDDLLSTEPDASAQVPGNLFVALNQAMDYAATGAGMQPVVFAVVNDANEMDAGSAALLSSRAKSEHVQLAIAATGREGYDALAPTMSDMRFDSCFTLAALQSFIRETIAQTVTYVSDSVLLSGNSEAAVLDVEPQIVNCGEVRVGETSCCPMYLYNHGNADLKILDIINPGGPPPTVPEDPIGAGQSIAVNVCITPTQLRQGSTEILVVYDGCGRDTVRVNYVYQGTDTLIVGIDAVVRGMPGSVVRIPVMIEGNLPASYNIRSGEIALTYDKTMLHPLEENIAGEGTLLSNLAGSSVSFMNQIYPAEHRSNTIYTFQTAAELELSGNSGVLFSPPFLVLHGSAMETEVKVVSAFFADGVPHAMSGNSGTFIADSLGFHQQRLINADERINAKIVGTYPNPFNASVTIAFALREAADVRLAVYDALGRELRVLEDGARDAGLHRVRFDAQALPTGMYFYRLESGGAVLTGSMLYLK